MVILQIPLIHQLHLGNSAFGFFYLGFLFFLPLSLRRSYGMLIGFLVGLVMDVFSNTPGIHASACVFIMYIRPFWLTLLVERTEEVNNISVVQIGYFKSIYFLIPIVFVHHSIIFTIENGGFGLFSILISKIVYSTIFSSFLIFVASFLIASKKERI